jgi:hypothetical protein
MIGGWGARSLQAVSAWYRLRALARPARSRSRERYRRAALTFAATVTTKTVALAALLISVPLGIGYLGSERFGVWMTALSAAGLLSFANLGFDKGLLNALAAADSRDDRAAAGRLVATAFLLLGAVFAALLALFALFYPVTPWARLLNVGQAAAADAGPVMAALTLCALLALLASLVDTVQAAYQEGFLNGLWEGIGNLLALAALGAAILCGMSLPWLVWLLSALSQPIAVFLSAANALRFQLAAVLLLAAGSVALKLLLSRRLGMIGVAWGRVGAKLLLLLPHALYLPSLIARLRRRSAMA